jgi:ubiquinone/menaquinone biosynthesis C-methylase UbiE
MDHFQRIYQQEAEGYSRLMAGADVDGRLAAALHSLTPFSGKKWLDLGTGTGRIPAIVTGQVAQLIALDKHLAMLKEQLSSHSSTLSPHLAQADMQALPLPSHNFDVVTAGWAIGHSRFWESANWQETIGQMVLEMRRVAAPGGLIIIIETMGTGVLSPAPPNKELAEYYTWLEAQWGFARQVIPIDYEYESVEDAAAIMGFFFGQEMGQRVRQNNWKRVPEWAGLWGWRQ